MADFTSRYTMRYGFNKTYPCYTTPWFTGLAVNRVVPTDTRSATVNRVRDASGWRAPTPYSRFISKGSGHLSTHHAILEGTITTVKNPTWSCPVYEYTADPWVFTCYSPQLPAFPPSLSSRAVNEALLKLKDRAPNLSEAFGERRETVRMITEHVNRIRRAITYARRHRWRDVARILRCRYKTISTSDFASGWLQYRYGWMPLLSDTYETIKWLTDNDLKRPDRYNIHVIRNITTARKDDADNYVTLNGSYHKLWYRARRETQFRAKVRLDYTLANPVLATASQLGITNPLYLLYAWSPFSFIADWYLPIGDYLNALDASSGWLFRGGSRTLVSRSKVKVVFPTKEEYYSLSPSNIRDGYQDCDLTLIDEPEVMDMNRTVYLTSPSPELPRFDPDLFRVKRLLDAIALLRQISVY